MRKVFLYLYPIKEYASVFDLGNEYYDYMGYKRPFDILNEAIDKRYRQKGYEVIYAIYPDKNIYGIIPKDNDKFIKTDVTFKEATGYNEDGTEKLRSNVKYPNEEYLLNQIGNVDKLLVGGYHWSDCVKRVVDKAIDLGIDAIIDLDMTDIFFGLYRDDYFKMDEEYDPDRYKQRLIDRNNKYHKDPMLDSIMETFGDKAYGFNFEHKRKTK